MRVRLFVLTMLVVVCSAGAQQPSEPIVAVDLVKAKPGQRERLIRFYQLNWEQRRVEALARGMITGYRLLVSADTGTRWDVMLETTYADIASYAARERNFGALIARNPAQPIDGMMRAALGDIVESRDLTVINARANSEYPTTLEFPCRSAQPCDSNRVVVWDEANRVPRFPVLLQSVGIRGDAHVTFSILPDGRVDSTSVRVVRTVNPAFGRQVVAAVQGWRFRRWSGSGIPEVSPEIVVEFGFALSCAPMQGESAASWFREESPPRLVVLSCPMVLIPRDQ